MDEKTKDIIKHKIQAADDALDVLENSVTNACIAVTKLDKDIEVARKRIKEIYQEVDFKVATEEQFAEALKISNKQPTEKEMDKEAYNISKRLLTKHFPEVEELGVSEKISKTIDAEKKRSYVERMTQEISKKKA
jgi:hypothetical protein